MAKDKQPMKVSRYFIDKHKLELLEMFEGVQGPQRPGLDIQIDRVAFMLAQCDELEKIIKDKGSLTWYENGKQAMWIENPATKLQISINRMILNYMDKMQKLLPTAAPVKNELQEFLNKKLKAVK